MYKMYMMEMKQKVCGWLAKMKSSEQHGIFQAADGRVKLISTCIFVALVTMIYSWYNLVAVLFIFTIELLAMNFPIYKHLKRLMIPVFLVGIMSALMGLAEMSSGQGVERGIILFLRALCAVFAINAAVSSMTVPEVLHSMKGLRVPDMLVSLVGFTLRYADVFSKEMSRMMTARKSRGYSPGKNLWHFATMKIIGQTIGALFLRSYERSERIYFSMLSRGYTGGTMPLRETSRIKAADLFAGISIVLAPAVFKMAEMRGISWIALLK
jgi:cobalt/nickel transport system permease protein